MGIHMWMKKGLLLFGLPVFLLVGCSVAPTSEGISEISRKAGGLPEEVEVLPSLELPEINWEIEYTAEKIKALGIREDMLAYWLVLNNKKAFVSTDEDGQKFYLNEYFWYLDNVEPEYHADNFMIVDMDGDGKEEVVLECSPGVSQVLHYEDGEVYSYQFGIRGMKRIHINGIYDASSGAAHNYYLRLTELNKDGYTEEMLVEMDDMLETYYEVEGREVTQAECWDYVESIESVELAECMEFTESMLDEELLENLTEAELSLVKRIRAEDMPVSEPDYQKHRQALQLYAPVLIGADEIIDVKKDTFWDELTWVYFSIVDMDGDGVDEIVLTGDKDVFQILHYEEGEVYGYQLRPYESEIPAITTDGVFLSGSSLLSGNGSIPTRIVAFGKNGCTMEAVEDYDIGSHDRIRYYYLSEERIAQWLGYPSLDSYWNDSLVLLNQFHEDIRLYGINKNNRTAMLLSVAGEKVLIEEGPFPSFQNFYQELPKLNVFDADGDGADEVMISLRTVTGSPISRYGMLVCDREDEWKVYMYCDYLEDIQDIIRYRYDDDNNSFVFLDNGDNILWEGKLPEWTKEYAYTGIVSFGDNIRFDAEAFQMEIVPGIELENSLPYEPIKIVFNLGFMDGEFRITGYEVEIYRV